MSLANIKAIVTDIEGTTSSISFVHDVLFPYAAKELHNYVTAHNAEPEVSRILDEVRTLIHAPNATIAQIIEQLLQWIAEDKKITPLKTLQGLMWAEGYQYGDFKGHVYEDAYRHLIKWHHQQLPIYIFSSGSVQAQKLLFGFSVFGDLTAYLSGYFDTTIGAKKESAAYEKIATTIGMPAQQILFLSDIEAELDAAHQAGMQTTWLIREGELPNNSRHLVAKNFDEIIF